ncbi:MAG: hypothetical protein JSS64_07740 [Bacteroidetes bacterium]|nr:hypothetical protein [Bacteroidota bacterium]
MKVLLFGNVGSGKTTLISKLKEIFSFEVIAIDDYRRKYGDGTKEGEILAKKNFLQSIILHKNQFIECIGVGQLADDLYELLSHTDEKIVCLTIIVPKEVCKTRLESRVWDIPFPEPLEKVFILLKKTELRIEDGLIEEKWKKLKNVALIFRNNTLPCDSDMIVEEVSMIINESLEDYEHMLKSEVQSYYGNEYLTYQKQIIEKNDSFLQDRLMISKFIKGLNVTGNVVDIGSGNCQWFQLFEPNIHQYFAIEVNTQALSVAPRNKKVIAINRDIFDPTFKTEEIIRGKIDLVFFSFFLSHFSDASIQVVFEKLPKVASLLIIDSHWGDKHELKYQTKNLRDVKREISPQKHINLPKRFFEYSDIESLVTSFGYSITKFESGNYWFVCLAKR